MKKSIFIKESLPEDLLVKVGEDFIAPVKPSSTLTGEHTCFYANKACVLTSVRGNVQFSTDGSNWSNSMSVADSSTKIYIKTDQEDGIVFSNGAIFKLGASTDSDIKDTSILIDLLNLKNSAVTEITISNSAPASFRQAVKGNISLFKGNRMLKGSGIQLGDAKTFIFGDITGVFDSLYDCSLDGKYVFGDITQLLEHHDTDAGAKQLMITYNDTTTFDKFTCKLFYRGVYPGTERVVIQQQMRAESIINILNSLAASPNANRNVILAGEESAEVNAAITAFLTANAGTLTYNGTVRTL